MADHGDPGPRIAEALQALTGGNLRVESALLTKTTGEADDARIEVLPWEAGLIGMQAGIDAGAKMFQRFVCDACRAIQTMPDEGRVYIQGRCSECRHITDLRLRGFGVYGVIAPDDATPEQRARFESVIDTAAAEVKAMPDNVDLIAAGRPPMHKVHRAPCRNCGEPDHHGKPCMIRAHSGRKRL